MRFMLREESLCLLIVYARVNDDIFTLFPVNGGSNTVLVADLESFVVT